MLASQNITLDVNKISMFSYINGKQNDSGRRINVRITVDGVNLDVPSSATVILRAIKPDDTVIYHNGIVMSDGRVAVRFPSQMLAVEGKVYADISVLHDNRTVSTVSFAVLVRRVPYDETVIKSDSSFGALTALVNSLTQYDAQLTTLTNDKANGHKITVELADDILTVTEDSD